MDIFLLRHGVSVSNEQHLVCGAADYPLSESGLRQARHICERLNELSFSRIYCSPLIRARQTIAYLAHPKQPELVDALVELDTGEASHISVKELWEHDNRYRYQGLYPDLKYPGGECLNDMLARVQGWFRTASAGWQTDDSVLIAGHEGTVCAILHYLLSLSIAHYPTFAIGNCDYAHVHINADNQVRYRFVPLQHQDTD